MRITRPQTVLWLEHSAVLREEKKAYLTELDSPIGDADHGINMGRRFGKLAEKLPAAAEKSLDFLDPAWLPQVHLCAISFAEAQAAAQHVLALQTAEQVEAYFI